MNRLALIFLITLVAPLYTHAAPVCDTSNIQLADYDHKRREKQVHNVKTDHFALIFSWSPGFCRFMKKKTGNIPAHLDFQCNSNQNFGWVVHGLWGQSSKGITSGRKGGHPRYCTKKDLAQLPADLIRTYMCLSPGAKLLQSQWEKHGACDFKSAEDYFSVTQKLASNLVLPKTGLKDKKMKAWMKAHNPALKGIQLGWLPTSGELAICYDTSFNLIDCR